MSISQDLTPKRQQINDRCYFCFTIEQSRSLSKLLELGKLCDTLNGKLSKENFRYAIWVQKKDSIIYYQEEKLKNYSHRIAGHKQTLRVMDASLQIKDKKIRQGKWHKILLSVALLCSTVTLLVHR